MARIYCFLDHLDYETIKFLLKFKYKDFLLISSFI